MKLHPYQEEALKFCSSNSRSYLMLSMGLGKTAISLYWCRKVLQDTKGVLVVAPLRTISTTWPEEIAKWTPELTYTILHGPQKADNLTDKVDLYIINYEGLPWLFDMCTRLFKTTGKVPFRGLILDEGSMVKSSATKRFKILKKFSKIFPKWRMILSGTPAPNSLLDLWSQYYILDDGDRLGKFITHYKQEHFYQVDRMGFIWSMRKGSDTRIYKAIEDITFRLDAVDYLKIPNRIDNIIKAVLPKKAQEQYNKLEKDFFLELEEKDGIDAFNAASLSMKLRQFVQGGVYTGEPTPKYREYEIFNTEKLKCLTSLVEEAAGQSILCAIQFKFELEMLKKKFPKAPIIAGGVKASESSRLINLWNKGELPLLLCHPASLSHGVNLQSGGHLIVWYGLTWSYEQYAQFCARLHRQGQKESVIIHHIVMQNTIDVNVMRALKNKAKGQQALLDYIKGVR